MLFLNLSAARLRINTEMHFLMILYCFLIVVSTFLFWELAWFTHKSVIYGFVWDWHRSHHTTNNHTLERNDLFALNFSTPCIGLPFYATLVKYNPSLLSVAIGNFCYGIFYFIFHALTVRHRIKFRIKRKSKYLQRIIRAHYIHHNKDEKEDVRALDF